MFGLPAMSTLSQTIRRISLGCCVPEIDEPSRDLVWDLLSRSEFDQVTVIQ